MEIRTAHEKIAGTCARNCNAIPNRPYYPHNALQETPMPKRTAPRAPKEMSSETGTLRYLIVMSETATLRWLD